MSPQKDGEVIERPPNRELFSTLYFNGFEQISSMYIDDTEIGLSFIKGRTYPDDYDHRGNKYHLEYVIHLLLVRIMTLHTQPHWLLLRIQEVTVIHYLSMEVPVLEKRIYSTPLLIMSYLNIQTIVLFM